MKKSLIAFFHSPSKVIALSLVIALGIGTYGYLRINEKEIFTYAKATSGTIVSSGALSTRNISLGFLASGRIKSVSVSSGDTVKKGQQLATLDAGTTLGTLTQAQASLAQAKANYDKIVNGATGPTIDVARSLVHTAEVSLTEGQKQQDTLVANAKRALLNSTPTAVSTLENPPKAPVISGTYTGDTEGTITITVHPMTNGGYFVATGLVSGTNKMSMTDPQPIGDSGLSILFPQLDVPSSASWTIDIPNTVAPNYLTNYNSYQAAVQTRTQTLATLQAAVDQAQANLTALVTAARPEDIAQAGAQVTQAQGTLQIAQAAYDNTVINAPYDGTVVSVSIAPGQIAQANAPAIEIQVKGVPVDALVMVPKTAIISSDGKNYVFKKDGRDVIKQEVTLGVSDANNVEIRSGLSVGDEVVTH